MERDLRAAAAAVEAAAGEKGWNVGNLAAAAEVDPATITDFLAARRWPRMATRGSIERALGWPAGSIARIAEGGAPPVVTPPAQDAEPQLPVGGGVDPELLTELAQADPAAIEAVRAVLKAARRGD